MKNASGAQSALSLSRVTTLTSVHREKKEYFENYEIKCEIFNSL